MRDVFHHMALELSEDVHASFVRVEPKELVHEQEITLSRVKASPEGLEHEVIAVLRRVEADLRAPIPLLT